MDGIHGETASYSHLLAACQTGRETSTIIQSPGSGFRIAEDNWFKAIRRLSGQRSGISQIQAYS